MRNNLLILSLLLILFSFSANAQEFILDSGMGGSAWVNNGCSLGPENGNNETPYGGSNSSNIVAEIDAGSCQKQTVCIVPNIAYKFNLKISRRTSFGCTPPSGGGIRMRIVGVQSGTVYFNNVYTPTNTTFALTSIPTLNFTPSATDKQLLIDFVATANSSTCGIIIDDASLKPLNPIVLSPTSVCQNTSTALSLSNLPSSGLTYAWNSGSGGTPSTSTATNPTFIWSSAGTKTITTTLNNGTCTSNLSNTFIVNAVPSISMNNPSVCSGVAFSTTPTSTVIGTTYTWTSSVLTAPTGGSLSGFSNQNTAVSAPISQIITNTGTTNGVVRYTVTPSNNGCLGTPITLDVTVKPIPTSSAFSTTICTGGAFNVPMTSNVSNTIYTATTSLISGSVTGYANVTSPISGPFVQTLTNSGSVNGVVRFTVTPSANSCVGSNFTFDVNVNPKPTASATETPICNNTAFSKTPTSNIAGTTYTWTSAIVVTPTGGTITGFSNQTSAVSAPISQTLTNTGTTSGTVRYTVTPYNGSCAGIPFTFDVQVRPNIVLNPTSTSIACNGGTSTISTAITSGTGAYTYSLNGGALQSTGTFTNKVAGTYTITVTGINGCTGSNTITISQPDTIAITLSVSLTNCNSSTSTLTVNSTGGTGIKTYKLNAGAYQSSNVYAGLAVGTYTTTVKDANACTKTKTVTITLPTALNASITSQSNVTCNGGSNGSATVTATGGITPYTYSWSAGGGTSSTISGKSAGTYTCTVTDFNGCTKTVVATITQTAPILLNYNLTASQSCASNGAATLSTVNGGTAPYTYSWSPSGGTGQSATGLAPNVNYTVTVSDVNGCSTTALVNVTSSTPLVLGSLTKTSVQCPTDSSTITITASGNSPRFYSLDGGANKSEGSPTTFKAIAGTHTITVEGGDGCTKDTTFTIVAVDNTNPTVTCPSNVATTVSAGTCAKTVNSINLSASDNCNLNKVTWSTSGATTLNSAASGINNASGSTFNKGTTTVTYIATDLTGNSSTCNFTVTVNDNINPTITCPSNKIVAASSTCDKNVIGLAPISVNDNCSVSSVAYAITGATTTSGSNDASGLLFNKGTNSITYTVTDASGNTNTCSFDVVVNDSTKPVINCLTNQTLSLNVSCSVTMPDFTSGVAVSDNCSPSNLITITQSPVAGTTLTGPGSVAVKLYATDEAGNIDSCTFNVIKDNVNPPVINCIGAQDLYLSVNCTAVLPDYTSLLTYGNVCTGTAGVSITQSPAPGTIVSGVGQMTVTFTAYDSSNSTSSNCSSFVNKIDTIAPQITCPSAQNLYLNSSCAATMPDLTSQAVATDGCTSAASMTYTQTPTSGSSLNTTGNFSVTISAMDASGNVASCSLTASKLDTIKPTITCPSTISTITTNGLCSATIPSLGAPLVLENCGILSVTNNHPSNVYNAGSTTVTWTVTDINGNSNTCTQNVVVTDNQAPTITTCAASQTIYTTSSCSALVPNFTSAVSANDNCTASGSLTITQSPVAGSTAALGNTTITITVTDANSNSSTCITTLTVTDTVSSVSNAGLAQTVSCAIPSVQIGSSAVSGYSYSWNPASGLSATNIAQPMASPTSNTTYTVTVTSPGGCTATSTVLVSVDNSLPTANAGATQNLNCTTTSAQIGTTAVGQNTYSWLPTSGLSASTIAQPTASPSATTTYTVTVSGTNGCTATSTVVVNVNTTQPTADAGSTLNLNCTTNSGLIGTTSIIGNTYSWSPASDLSATNIAQPTASPSTTTTYTVTVTGTNGCTATSTVLVNKDNATIAVDAGSTLHLDCLTTSGILGTTAVSGATYSWLPTTGLSNANIAQPIASPSSTTVYTVTATNTNGCTSSDTVTVFSSGTAITLSAPSITSLPNNQYCFGSNVILKAMGDPTATFNWNTPVGCPVTIDNSVAGESKVSISNLSASCNGTFKVNQSIPSCSNSSAYDSIIIDGGVKPTFNFVSTSCVSNAGEVTVNSTPSASMQYAINGGAFQNSNVLNTPAGSTFVVAAKSQNSSCVSYYSGNCVNCANSLGCINPPKDSLVAPSVVCVSNIIPLENYISNASNATFTTTGTGTLSATSTNSTTTTFSYTPSANDKLVGSVIITATTNDPDGAGPCQASVTSKNILLINSLVAPNIVSNSPVCENSQLNIEAVNAIGTVLWQNANGYSSNNAKDSILNTPANMQGPLVATISAYGCSNVTASQNINVIAAPNLSVNVSSLPELCAGQGNGSIQVSVAGGSGNYTICYNSNLSNCANGTSANFQYVAPGNYNVTIVDQACPNNTFSYPVTVGAGVTVPSPSVTPSISICSNENLVLSGTTSLPGSTINWTFAGNNFNAVGNPVIRHYATTNMSGVYSAKTIDANGCASLPVNVQVTVNETPVINHVQVNCVSGTAHIEVTATLSTGTIAYSLDGTTYQASNIFDNYAPGNYTLYVKNNATNCIATDYVYIPNCACPNEPYVTIVHPLTSCGTTPIPMTATFTNVSNAIWTTAGTGAFSTTSGASPLATIYTPSAAELLAGEIHLTITTDDPDASGPCGQVSRNVTIKLVNDIQQPAITLNQVSYCTGDSITLMSNVNTAVEWFGVGGFYSTKPNAVINNATQFLSGYYKVVASGNGCTTKKDSVFVTIAPAPSINVTTNVVPEFCEGHGNGEITVNVTGGTGNYTVCNDLGINCNNTTSSYTFKWLAPGTYQIYVADNSCPNARTLVPVTVNPGTHVDLPTSASYNNPVCAGEDLVLTATGSVGSHFLWTDIKNNYTDTGATISRTNTVPEMSGMYKVQRVENGCASADYYLDVHVYDNPAIASIDTLCVGSIDSGRITVNASIATGNTIEYAINNGAFQTSNVFNNLSNGLYEIKARAVGSDCVTTLNNVELYCNCHCNKDAIINVFPNPNEGTFSVNATLQTESSDITIAVYDLSGRTVYQTQLTSKAGQLKHDINIKRYATGAYMLKMTIDGEAFVRPIMVNR